MVWADKKSDDTESDPQLHYTKINPYLDDMDGDNATGSEITLVDDIPLVDDTFKTGGDADMKIDSGDNIHLVFVDKEDKDGIYYMKLDKNGNITLGPKQYHSDIEFEDLYSRPQLEIDSGGDVHIAPL